MSALNAASKRLLSTAFPQGGAYLVASRYDANDDLLPPFAEGPAGSFDLPDDADLYYCVGSIAPGNGRTAIDRVWVLVIDDVGKEINQWGFDVTFPLKPSFIVESSKGSYQYGFIIKGGMAPDEYRALRLAMRANALWGDAHNTGAAAIYRLPQGMHTKSTRRWIVREELWAGVSYEPAAIWDALAPAGAPRAPGKGSDADLIEDEELLKALVELIPNAVADWDKFVNTGRAIWGASNGTAPDVFDGWAAKCPDYDAAITAARWDSYHDASIGRYWLLRAAMAADPAGAEAWLKEEAAALFNDGAVLPVSGGDNGGGLPRALQLKYAREIARRWGGGMRYVLDRKAWAEFNGTVWNHMPSGVKLGGQYALAMAERAPPKGKGDHDVTTLSFLDGVEGICRQIPELQCREADFDSNPWLLGTPEGTVDLRTGALVPAKASDMISKSTVCGPADTAACPRWLRFLEEVTEKDDESILFLQQWAGYCLTGLTVEEKIVFLFGPGGNGKSKFADMLAWVMKSYAAKPVSDLFIKKVHGMGHTSKLAMLAGARMATISEVPAGAQWDEGLLKDVTGGGMITAGFKHKDEFTFEPQFKLLAIGNHQPTFPGGIDDAIRRRFMMMEFRFKAAPPDLELMGKLQKEGRGILRWMIDGCLLWQKTGLMKPHKVEVATEAMFTEQDLLGRWIIARIDRVKGSTVGATDLFNDWREWCNERGEHEQVGTSTAFGRELVDRRNFTKKPDRTGTMYQDIKLKPKAAHVFDD